MRWSISMEWDISSAWNGRPVDQSYHHITTSRLSTYVPLRPWMSVEEAADELRGGEEEGGACRRWKMCGSWNAAPSQPASSASNSNKLLGNAMLALWCAVSWMN